jgi:very-short-patch-repair endonuclease
MEKNHQNKVYPEDILKANVLAHHEVNPESIYTGQSSFAMHGISRYGGWKTTVDCATREKKRGCLWRPDMEAEVIDGVECVVPLQALGELAEEGESVVSLTVSMEDLMHKGLVTRDELKEFIDGFWGKNGVKRLRRAYRFTTGKDESWLETLVRLFLVAWRYPVFQQQVWLEGADGNGYRVDFFLKRYNKGVILEADGVKKHQMSPDSLIAEQERYQALVGAGYTIVRITYKEYMKKKLGKKLAKVGVNPRRNKKHIVVNKSR